MIRAIRPKLFFALALISVFAAGCSPKASSDRVCFEKQCFFVELAQNEQQWTRGLQLRESLGEDKGMLFIFPRSGMGGYFWMKDALIPLDIIWLNENKKVVSIAANAQPCPREPCPTYSSTQKARFVLEINGGLAERFGIKEGSGATFYLKN